MVEVHFTPGGESDFVALAVNAKIDVIHKLETVEQVGLKGELKIGEISPDLSVYLLLAGTHHVAVVHNKLVRPPSCHVVAVHVHAPIELTSKTGFVSKASVEMGIGSQVVIY